jgi:synaptobrevin homolog YKT6
MKIFSISIINAPPYKPSTSLSSVSDLSSFSFYQRGSVQEFMTFFSKTVADRTKQGQRQSIQENSYTAHVYNRGGAEQLVGASLRPIAISVLAAALFCLETLLAITF